jgi:hypothetical protein
MIPLNLKTSETKAKELLVFNLCLCEVLDVIWAAANYTPLRERYYYTIFMKLLSILDSIVFQVANLDSKPHYTLSTILCLRTCMLDTLSLYYVMDTHEDILKVTERINSIMADHLKYTYNEFSQEEKDDIRQTWPDLFDANGNLKKFGQPGTKLFLNGIATYNTLKEEADTAKDIYTIFSKYEHNGAFTFDLLHNHYSPKGIELVKWKIYEALGVCACACKLISTHWVDNEGPLANKMNAAVIDLLRHSID